MPRNVRPVRISWYDRLNLVWRLVQILVSLYLVVQLGGGIAAHWVGTPWAPMFEVIDNAVTNGEQPSKRSRGLAKNQAPASCRDARLRGTNVTGVGAQ